jgi:hypothetical protein
MKQTILFLFLILVIGLVGCDKSTEPEDGTHEAVINHSGYDFSERKSGSMDGTTDYEKIDGETICWSPQPNSSGDSWGTRIWFRPAVSPIKMYKLGPVDFESVTSVDESRWQTSFDDKPLANGDVWVFQARDGYVKFKVLDAPNSKTEVDAREWWWVKVQFKYSPNKNF